LFHVEPEFNYQWQSYKKILQQRNSAIRQRKKTDEIQIWDIHLASYGEKITTHRKQQLTQLLDYFETIFARICPEFSDEKFSIRYKNGWAKDRNLAESLQQSLERDQKLGYTRSGSHAADWSFRVNDIDPADVFSRGQQKLFVLALCMAQAKITDQTRHEDSLLLLDDISSELDGQHQQLVLNELVLLPVQAFITSTDSTLYRDNATVFHVKHGSVFSS